MSGTENQDEIVLWIWMGIGILLLIVLFITLLTLNYLRNMKKNKKKAVELVRKTRTGYMERTLDLQEKDRQRLAGELHDHIIGRLNLIRLNLDNKDKDDLNRELKKSMQL